MDVLCESCRALWAQLMAQARGAADAASASPIRAQANALVLRSTQAYLTAPKPTGFLRSPAGPAVGTASSLLPRLVVPGADCRGRHP